MGISVNNGNYYTPMVGGGEANILQTYNTEGVSAPDVKVNSPVIQDSVTASELAGNGVDYSSSVSMNFDKFFSEQTDRIAGETQSFLNGLKSPDVQLTFGGEDDGGGMMANLWKEFKSLDGKTQSVLASTLFSAIGGVMKNDTAKDKLRQDQQVLDLKRQQQDNAMRSTAESYDKSKYKVRGLLNPEAKLTYSTQTGVKK
jgi:hypothetical protein